MENLSDKMSSSIICIDTSGSVSCNNVYWHHVANILENWSSRFPDTKYVLWNSTAETKTKEYVEQNVKSQSGSGGTEPSSFIPIAKKLKTTKNLCLVTDGEVCQNDVEYCDKLIQDGLFETAECHIINYRPNLSVVCPFTRKNNSKVWVYTTMSEPVLEQNINREDYLVLDTLETLTLENFLKKYTSIRDMIFAITTGTQGNQHLKNKVIALKKKIINQISGSMGSEWNQKLRSNVHAPEEFSKVVQEMLTEYFSQNSLDEVSKKLDTLVGLCGDMRSVFTKTQVAHNSMQRTELTEEQAPVESTDGSDFECPITYDTDEPCICITTGDSVLTGVDKSKVDFIIECPLRLLLDPELVAKTRGMISHAIGLKTLQETGNQDPFTRKEILGVICLGNHEQNFKATNWTMSHMFSQGKLLGNPNMWLLVLYWIAKDCEYLSDVHQKFLEHLKYRFACETTYASLCGLATHVTTKVSVDLAMLWVLVAGSQEYTAVYTAKSDPLRFHLPESDLLVKSVQEIFGCDVVTPKIVKSIKTTKALQKLLVFSKNFIQSTRSEGSTLAQKWSVIQACCYQKSRIVSGFVVLYDGEQDNFEAVRTWLSEQSKFDLSDFTQQEIYNLVCSVDASKAMGDTVYTMHKVPESLYNWGVNTCDLVGDYIVPICYATFRPWSKYQDQELNKEITWQESAELRYSKVGGLSNLINGTKYFLDFFVANRRIPTEEEYTVYCYKRVSNSQLVNKSTLPKYFEQVYPSMMSDFKEVFMRAKQDNLSCDEIIKRIKDSTSKVDRERIEKEFIGV